ncbi:MAG: NAD(P)/FAD-dependent oxidoreductase [Minisyncoccia bacterium]
MLYDLIILGSGPAGLAASIYASRYKIRHLIIGQVLGGLANQAHLIENYPGCRTSSGKELMDKFLEQAKSYGVEIIEKEVVDIFRKKDNFEVQTSDGKIFTAKTLILALGTEQKKLNIPGEKEFLGKGVTYCATCDAPLYKNKTVAVVGGGNAALTAALLLANYAQKVYLIHRRDKYSAELIWQEKVFTNPKIEKIFNTNLKEIKGEQVMNEIILDQPWQNATSLKVSGLFIEIGSLPSVDLAKKIGLALDEKGYIKVDKNCRTNVRGVFAAGDVTNYTDLKQVLTAASQGAIAAFGVYKYLNI